MKRLASLIDEEDLNTVYNDFLSKVSLPSGWTFDDTGLTEGYDTGYFPCLKKIPGFDDTIVGMHIDDSQRPKFEFYLENSLADLNSYNKYKEELDTAVEQGTDLSNQIQNYISENF